MAYSFECVAIKFTCFQYFCSLVVVDVVFVRVVLSMLNVKYNEEFPKVSEGYYTICLLYNNMSMRLRSMRCS